MSTGFVGFVVGAAVPVALAELREVRRARVSGDEPGTPTRGPLDGAPDWDATMPAPRTALRPRWESSSDPADEDDLAEFLVTVVVAVLVVAGAMLTASSLPRFAMFFLVGLVASALGTAVYAVVRRRNLPPHWSQVLVRSAIVWLICTAALLWFTATRFRGLGFDGVHGRLQDVGLRERPREVHRSFEGDGVLFYVVIGLGLLLVVGLLISVLVDLVAMFAATQLGEGSRRGSAAWLAQLYPRRQLRLWVTSIGVALLAFLLLNGTVLSWYDDVRKQGEVNPSDNPIVLRPAGTVPAPTTTVRSPTSTTPVAVTTTTLAEQVLVTIPLDTVTPPE